MTIDEARGALRELEQGPVPKAQSSGPQRWVDDYREGDEAFRARSHEVAWTLVHEGDAHERSHALAFWGAVPPPQGVADALAELYLDGSPPDASLRAYVGHYAGPPLSDEIGQRLAARFAADPEGERDLAAAALRVDPQGAAWDGLIRLILTTQDAAGLHQLYHAADAAGRLDDFLLTMRVKPEALVRDLAALIPSAQRMALGRATGLSLA